MLTDDVVSALVNAVKHLDKESHLLKGFIRFSVFSNALVAAIEPKNYVLPFLARHFRERYPEERFLIYDKTHRMGLAYQPYKTVIIPIEELQLPEADEDEQAFRALWRLFYHTIEIKERHNPCCRMSLMPKRYWDNMTEFGDLQTGTTLKRICSDKQTAYLNGRERKTLSTVSEQDFLSRQEKLSLDT
jgi:probable DNA metabolism protein